MKAKVIILKNPYQGFPKESNYQIVEEELRDIKDGEFLVEAVYITVSPYMRLFAKDSDVGKPVSGQQVGKIIQSKNDKYPVEAYVIGEFGWRTYTIADEKAGGFIQFPPIVLPEFGNLPKSLALGTLGGPGNAAYFGFLEICKPKAGDTVVVSAASGAVGTVVGQIAKIKGCRVVGITGSDEKGQKLVREVGYDAYVNYKSDNFEEELVKATPKKIDCYFDNVGGEVSSIVLTHMNKFGRVSVCGSIASYNSEGTAKASEVQTPVKVNHLRMEGFQLFRWRKRWNEGLAQLLQWTQEGKLKYHEHVTEGFENTGKAFIGMLRGENFGKALVKV